VCVYVCVRVCRGGGGRHGCLGEGVGPNGYELMWMCTSCKTTFALVCLSNVVHAQRWFCCAGGWGVSE
jgi:hypothetical protein